MKNAFLILAFVAASVSMPLRAAAPVMTNRTIQAMLSGGIPLPTIIRSVKTAKQVDLYINDREYQQLLNAGASKTDADAIMKAINFREWNGVDTSPDEPIVREETAPPVKVSPFPASVAVVAKAATIVPAAPAVPTAPVAAPVVSPTVAISTPPVPPSFQSTAVRRIVLEDATPIRLRLTHNLSSADATTSEKVDFEVLEEVRIGDQIVIPKGAVAWGTITDAEAKKSMGRAGKLNVNIDSVRLADGERAALRGIKDAKGASHTAAVTASVVATSLVLWPAAPLFLLRHGKDATIPEGTEIAAYINGNVTLDASKFASQ